jgi:hypothetical protein
MENNYDSTADTLKHIKRVQEYLIDSASILLRRAVVHDASKLEEPEKSIFDVATPKLAGIKFGTPEYTQSLEDIKPALEHHYAVNSHHPQHYKNGINGMDLFDIVEMLVDWKASSERTKDGDIMRSIELNAERFGMSEQLVEIFKNTALMLFSDR